MNTSNTPATVPDSTGAPLIQGAIVQIINITPDDGPGPLDNYRGVVLSPHEEIIVDPQYSVPVFFFEEVPNHYLWIPGQRELLTEWKKKHATELKEGDPSFLFKDGQPSTWESYPRVRYFQSSELMICEGLTSEDMITRLFRDNYTQSFKYAEHVPKDPRACSCVISGCSKQATNLSHYNVHGSISPAYMCSEHHRKWNGVRTDDPPLKPHLCLLDGTEVRLLAV
jgi:hypothetical protein